MRAWLQSRGTPRPYRYFSPAINMRLVLGSGFSGTLSSRTALGFVFAIGVGGGVAAGFSTEASFGGAVFSADFSDGGAAAAAAAAGSELEVAPSGVSDGLLLVD